MISTRGYAAHSGKDDLKPFSFERRDPGPHDIEKIAMNQINEAYDRMLKSDVKYRFGIDMATL